MVGVASMGLETRVAGLPGRDAGIIPAGHAKHCRVLHPCVDVLHAVHGKKGRTLNWILHCAEFGGVAWAIRTELHAHGIGATDVADGGCE